MFAPPPASLIVDATAIAANWQRFAAVTGPASCGAAVKADGYGVGAREAAAALIAAGCRDLYVAHWGEAAALGRLPADVRLAVFHGVMTQEMPVALASSAVPILVTPAQILAWRETGRSCDVMVDTGMNRLGLTPEDAASGLLDGLAIDTLHSHLACAEDGDPAMNGRQRAAFAAIAARIPARRRALANSAGIGLGSAYHLDHARPGIGLYGGGPSPDGTPLAPVVQLSARIVQLRDVPAGSTVGYGATFTATRSTRLAIVALGYADGYARSLTNTGRALVAGIACPVAGRVSMDLTAFDVTDAPPLAEGDMLTIDFDLAATAAAAGRSQYELLTGLGHRYARQYR